MHSSVHDHRDAGRAARGLTAERRLNVLLVDDHRTVLWGLARLVSGAADLVGHVVMARSGEEALAAVAGVDFDLAVLDVQLGGEDGLSLIGPLREAGVGRVLLLTGMDCGALAQRALSAGASGIVHKSEPADTLLDAIRHVSQGRLWLDSGAGRALVDAPSRRASEALTRREREIVARVVARRSAPLKVIADEMHLSAHTLRNHLNSIYEKLGLHGRLELFLYATEHGLAARPDAPAR